CLSLFQTDLLTIVETGQTRALRCGVFMLVPWSTDVPLSLKRAFSVPSGDLHASFQDTRLP
ncbi:hypothetical protein QBK93_36465, partial [Rhizobium leguminosarum]|uniref:hypothetical protein n=1 Tax=Rhizobium leguminosarum TaxID=384 RepID=UPI0024A94C95